MGVVDHDTILPLFPSLDFESEVHTRHMHARFPLCALRSRRRAWWSSQGHGQVEHAREPDCLSTTGLGQIIFFAIPSPRTAVARTLHDGELVKPLLASCLGGITFWH